MRRMEALLPPARLDEVLEALSAIGAKVWSLSEVKSVAPANRRRDVYRGSIYLVDFVAVVKIEIMVRDAFVPAVMQVLRKTLGASALEAPPVVVTEVSDIIDIGAAPSADVAFGLARP
jgi:nitrogen regulatory protein P-II 1